MSYELKPCDFGVGIFAKEFIPIGTLIWRYVRNVNVLSFNNADEVCGRWKCMQIRGVGVNHAGYETGRSRHAWRRWRPTTTAATSWCGDPLKSRNICIRTALGITVMQVHAYMYDGVVNEILDDGRFWNHSEKPNTGLLHHYSSIAC